MTYIDYWHLDFINFKYPDMVSKCFFYKVKGFQMGIS